MKKKRRLAFVIVLVSIIVMGSATYVKKPRVTEYTLNLDGLYITLDDTWDVKRKEYVYPMETEMLDLLNGVNLNKIADKEIECSLQIDHLKINNMSYNEYIDYACASQENDRIFDEEIMVGKYQGRKIMNLRENSFEYLITFGKGKYMYSISFQMDSDKYEEYLKRIDAMVDTIEITSIKQVGETIYDSIE